MRLDRIPNLVNRHHQHFLSHVYAMKKGFSDPGDAKDYRKFQAKMVPAGAVIGAGTSGNPIAGAVAGAGAAIIGGAAARRTGFDNNSRKRNMELGKMALSKYKKTGKLPEGFKRGAPHENNREAILNYVHTKD